LGGDKGGGMFKRFLIMAILLAGVGTGLAYYNYVFKPKMIAQFTAENAPPPTAVAVVSARKTDVPQALTGIGTIEAVHQVMVAPEVAGRIVQIFFEPGATVKAGDPLVQLYDKPERGDLQNFQAQQHVAELNLHRSQQLVGRYTPQATVDQDKALLDQAEAGIAKTEALIAQKLVKAPFAGQLGIRQVDLGQYVQAGATIVTLTNLDQLYVNFTLPEQAKSQLAVGQKVKIAVDAYPDKPFEAKLTTIEPQVTADTRTLKLQAVLDNPGHLVLPGMFANASVVLPPDANVVVLPATAVDYSLYGDSVFVIKQSGVDGSGKPVMTATRVFVKTGKRFDNQVAILSGVNPGDVVAASGQLKLDTGTIVSIVQSGALTVPPQVPIN
jgi:multidrug efflux system membrane fusion protein